MKCVFCGSKSNVEERENQLLLCNNCFEVSQKAKEDNKEEENMINKDNLIEGVEFQTVEEAVENEVETSEVSDIKCEIILGIKETGELYFNATGNSPDLLTIDGLIKFGKRRMSQIWEAREQSLPTEE